MAGFDPSNSPNPKPVAGNEIQVAIFRVHPGKEVLPRDDRAVAALENKAVDHFSTIGDFAKPALEGMQFSLQGESISRRTSDAGSSVTISPRVYDELSESGGIARYFLPPWPELYPEINDLLGRRRPEPTSDAKQVQVMTLFKYAEDKLELLKPDAPIGLMYHDLPLAEGEDARKDFSRERWTVLWSAAAFLEASKTLIEDFAALTKSKHPRGEPLDPEVQRLKLGSRRSHRLSQNESHIADMVPLEEFLQNCPSHLAGLAAREIAKRIIAESADQIRRPEAFIREVHQNAQWGLLIKVTMDGADHDLIISRRQPEALSFDWADQNYGAADLGDDWTALPERE
jgi:hypothetical protein